ncbi:uncharacterized protein LOC124158917 [Ischnura elegans]|uniref:uncharacterized protein LOC124158917 n=1 Tax=Ischnura elegans TaxID=197161 RepID=UPI001ED88A39|nr:uncharacterized protein LOC124158917 [Ischnura elegans]XP_046390293.1 uncharacterized protein LOC124158917 [Ischnura elegans]
MVIGVVLNYNDGCGQRASQVRARYIGRGPFADHEERQPALKLATEISRGRGTMSFPIGSRGDGSNCDPTSRTLVSQSLYARRNPSQQLTQLRTAEVIKSKHSSGESGRESLSPVRGQYCSKVSFTDLISMYGGAPCTSGRQCQPLFGQGGMYSPNLRSSAPVMKNKQKESTSAVRDTRSQLNHESKGKMSTLPTHQVQRTVALPRVPRTPHEESILRLGECPQMAYRKKTGEQSIKKQGDRGALSQPISPRVAADLFWNSFDKNVSPHATEKQSESQNKLRLAYSHTSGIEVEAIRRRGFPSTSRECVRLFKSSNEHKQEHATDCNAPKASSSRYSSARAVFANERKISNGFHEGEKTPTNFQWSPPFAKNHSVPDKFRFSKEEIKMATQMKSPCNAISLRKDRESNADQNYRQPHIKTFPYGYVSSETSRRKVMPNTSAINSILNEHRSIQPNSSHADWNGWCNRYLASKNKAMLNLQDRKEMKRVILDGLPKSSSEGLRKSVSSINDTSPQTRTNKSTYIHQAQFKNQQKVNTFSETARAKNANITSPSIVTVIVPEDTLAPRNFKSNSGNVSRRYGDVPRSSQHISASMAPRERTKNSQLTSVISLPTEKQDCPLLKYSQPSHDSGSSKKHSMPLPRHEVLNRCADVGACREYHEISSNDDHHSHSERTQNMRSTSQSTNAEPKDESENGLLDSDTVDQSPTPVGRVSLVVGFFEKLTLSEDSCKSNRERNAQSDNLDVVAEKKELGLIVPSRRPTGVKYASCPEEKTRNFKYDVDGEKCTSLPLDMEGVEIQPIMHNKIPRKTKVFRKIHRSVSLMNKDNRDQGVGTRRSHILKRSASLVCGSRTNRYSSSKRHFSEGEADDVFTTNNDCQGKNNDSTADDIQLELEIEENYLRRKLMSNSSDDSLDREQYSPDTDYKFFRRAVYGSVFACEEAYTGCHSTPSTFESDDVPSPSPSFSSSVGGRSSHGTKSESESEKSTSSSDENTDCDSGLADDSEEVETFERTKISEIAEIMGSKRILWSHIPEIAKGEFFRTLTSNQLKLQETKFEVITTEAYYMHCLCVAIAHFYGSYEFNDENIISKEDKDILFSNIIEVRSCSQKFLSDLKWCWKDDISLQDLDEIIYKHAVNYFGVYITYCYNQIYQSNVLNKLMKSDKFMEALGELESHPACQRRTLSCYLIMPMQRVTRIRLLVDAILARLSPDNQKYSGWKLASAALNKVVMKCNKAANHAAMQLRSHSLRKKLDFSGFKNQHIHLGDLQLVHFGEVFHLHSSNEPSDHLGALSSAKYRKIMKQPFTFGRKVKQPLHLFLFRDKLLITKKKSDNIFMVLVYCPRSDVEVSPGDPYSLQEIPQKNISENWKNVFHLFMQQGCDKGVIEMILSTSNEYEKNLWLDAFANRCISMESNNSTA